MGNVQSFALGRPHSAVRRWKIALFCAIALWVGRRWGTKGTTPNWVQKFNGLVGTMANSLAVSHQTVSDRIVSVLFTRIAGELSPAQVVLCTLMFNYVWVRW